MIILDLLSSLIETLPFQYLQSSLLNRYNSGLHSSNLVVERRRIMKRKTIIAVLLTLCFLFMVATVPANAQAKLSTRWEELTAPDFVQAIKRSQGTCLLPFGILEKHGAHLPLGTDLVNVRYLSLTAASQEYAVVFPEY